MKRQRDLSGLLRASHELYSAHQSQLPLERAQLDKAGHNTEGRL